MFKFLISYVFLLISTQLFSGQTGGDQTVILRQIAHYERAIQLTRMPELQLEPEEHVFIIIADAVTHYADQEMHDLELLRNFVDVLVVRRQWVPGNAHFELEQIAHTTDRLERQYLQINFLREFFLNQMDTDAYHRIIMDALEFEFRTRVEEWLNPIDMDNLEALEQARALLIRIGDPTNDADILTERIEEILTRTNDINYIRLHLNALEMELVIDLNAFRNLILNEPRFTVILENEVQQDLFHRIHQEQNPVIRDTLMVQLLESLYVIQQVIDTFNADINRQTIQLEHQFWVRPIELMNLARDYLRVGWADGSARLMTQVFAVMAWFRYLYPAAFSFLD